MSFVYYMRITGMTNEQRGVVMKEICTRRHAGGRGGDTGVLTDVVCAVVTVVAVVASKYRVPTAVC